VAGLAKQCGTPSLPGPSHRRARNAIWNATPSNGAQCQGIAQRGLCSSGIFSKADGDFARRRWSDALRKDVDGIAPDDCGARMGPIRHHFAQNAPCPPCAVTRDPLDCDCNATCHRPWLLGVRSERFAVVYDALLGETPSETPRLPLDHARSPEPAVFFDTQFRLVRKTAESA
jgi:hypothetical protein